MPRSKHYNENVKKRRLKGEHRATLPDKFEVKLFDEADGRLSTVKLLRRRLALLKGDTGAESYQQQLLCERAIFIATQLETLETTAAEGTAIDMGSYTQMVNCLSGLLSKLGLQKVAQQYDTDLRMYMKQKGNA